MHFLNAVLRSVNVTRTLQEKMKIWLNTEGYSLRIQGGQRSREPIKICWNSHTTTHNKR